MTILILCFGFLLLGLLLVLLKYPDTKPALLPAAAVVFLIFGILLFGNRGKKPEFYDLRWEESVAFTMGKTMAADGVQGGSVAVLTHSTGNGRGEVSQLQLENLKAGLGSLPVAFVVIDANDLLAEGSVWQGDEIHPGRLLQSLSGISDLSALVSFIGLPEALVYTQTPPLPPTYVYGTVVLPDEESGCAPRLNPGLRAVVRMLPGARFSATPKKKTPEDIFRERFVMVSAEDFSR